MFIAYPLFSLSLLCQPCRLGNLMVLGCIRFPLQWMKGIWKFYMIILGISGYQHVMLLLLQTYTEGFTTYTVLFWLCPFQLKTTMLQGPALRGRCVGRPFLFSGKENGYWSGTPLTPISVFEVLNWNIKIVKILISAKIIFILLISATRWRGPKRQPMKYLKEDLIWQLKQLQFLK